MIFLYLFEMLVGGSKDTLRKQVSVLYLLKELDYQRQFVLHGKLYFSRARSASKLKIQMVQEAFEIGTLDRSICTLNEKTGGDTQPAEPDPTGEKAGAALGRPRRRQVVQSGAEPSRASARNRAEPEPSQSRAREPGRLRAPAAR